MFYLRKELDLYSMSKVILTKLSYPSTGNWYCMLELIGDESYSVGDKVYFADSEYTKFSFFGEIREINKSNPNTFIVITGISFNKEKPLKSKQYLDSTFASIVTSTIGANFKLNMPNFICSYWTDKNATKLEVITRLCNTYKVNWHIDNESKFVFGLYLEDLDIEFYRSIATEIGYDYIVVPSQYIQIASNISALEYTETRTKIIL